jgi:hypothetical protein
MRIKVYGGTPDQSGRTLCEHCKHSTITRGRRLGDEIIRCEAQSAGTTLVTFIVTECTAYLDATLPSYPELLDRRGSSGLVTASVRRVSCAAASSPQRSATH